MNYTDDQIEQFYARLIHHRHSNVFVDAMLCRWIACSTRQERIAIMEEIDDSARRTIVQLSSLGEIARTTGETIANGLASILVSSR